MAVAAVDPGRGTEAVGGAAAPLSTQYDVIAVAEPRDAVEAHLIAGDGGAGRRADQRVAGIDGADGAVGAIAPGHRSSVAVPVLAKDDVIGGAERRCDDDAHQVAAMRADQRVGGRYGAA